MGTVTKLFDGLRNAITGAGTSRDPRQGAAYYGDRPLTQAEIHAAFTGSALIRKIIRIPALDMVREGRCWEMERKEIELLEKEEQRHLLQQKLLKAEVLRGMGGGAFVLGLPGLPSEPAPKVAKGGLAYINVVSRWHLRFSELNDDATAEGYGEPFMWQMTTTDGQKAVHPTRVITFRADNTATLAATSTYSSEDAYWGMSTVQHVLDAVKDSDTARASFAALLHKARLTRVGIPGLTDIVSTTGGEAAIGKRLETLAIAESLYNVSIYDSGLGPDAVSEKIDDISYNFAGAKDILNAYAEFVCAVSDIPATRLLGRAPEGLNSSGDSQQKDWVKKIRSMQTLDLKPCLDKLDAFLVPSALGSTPAKVDYDFEPLEAPDEDKTATRFKTVAEALNTIASLNAMPEQAFNEAAQNTLVEGEWMPGLGQALAKIPEAERFGIVADPSLGDPTDPSSNSGKEADPNLAGGGNGGLEAPAPRRAANDGRPEVFIPSGSGSIFPLGSIPLADATPRPLYVMRRVLNSDELQAWATKQGIGELQADLHVTIAASRQPIDWMAAQEDWPDNDNGEIIIKPGGPRLVEPLGGQTAVLLFASSHLSYRHERIKQAGASWDFPEFQPHVSLTKAAVDLTNVEPYRGKIVLGPEVFEEFDGGDS